MAFWNKKPVAAAVEFSRQECEDKLRAFVVAHTRLIGADELTPETRLFSSGIIDSVAFVELELLVEKAYKVDLSDCDVTMESWDSIADIVATVAAQTSRR